MAKWLTKKACYAASPLRQLQRRLQESAFRMSRQKSYLWKYFTSPVKAEVNSRKAEVSIGVTRR